MKKSVIWLGIVSLFTDVSSEMIFSVFPIFFTVFLGPSYSFAFAATISLIAILFFASNKKTSRISATAVQKDRRI